MFVRMRLFLVVASIARVHLGAAREAEPAVAFRVVATAASAGEFLASDDAKVFFGRFAAEGEEVPRVERGIGYEGEFRFRDLEAESAVAFAADGDAGCVSADGNDAGGGHGGAAGGTGWSECAGEHIGDGTAGQVEVASTDRVNVDCFAAERHRTGLGAFGTTGVTRVGRTEVGNVRRGFAPSAFDRKAKGGDFEEFDVVELQRREVEGNAAFDHCCRVVVRGGCLGLVVFLAIMRTNIFGFIARVIRVREVIVTISIFLGPHRPFWRPRDNLDVTAIVLWFGDMFVHNLLLSET